MRKLTLLSAFLVLSAPAALAASYYLSTDVPANLGGTTYEANDVVRSDDDDSIYSYSLKATHPSKANVNSLHQREDGTWQFSPAHPTDLGGTTYEARDVVNYNGSIYTMRLDGSKAAVGIPKSSRIDAFFYDASDNIVVSFDTPTKIGGVDPTYKKSDLVVYDAVDESFDFYEVDGFQWKGEKAGVPVQSNVVGADVIDGNLVVTFDVPTKVMTETGEITFKNGDLVQWDNDNQWFSEFFSDASWPPSAQTRGLCGLPSLSFPGGVPDGDALPGTPLKVDLAAGSDISLTWGTACSAGADDYGIYEGDLTTLASGYNHDAIDCSNDDSNLLSETVPTESGDRYYIVVPYNTDEEGSYGRDSLGDPRDQGGPFPCKATKNPAVCP